MNFIFPYKLYFWIKIALYWGCVFACMSFTEIWCVTPYIRCLHVCLYSFRKLFAIILGCKLLSSFLIEDYLQSWFIFEFYSYFKTATLGPFAETLGLIFSRIHVTSSTGVPPKPIGELPISSVQSKVHIFKS